MVMNIDSLLLRTDGGKGAVFLTMHEHLYN